MKAVLRALVLGLVCAARVSAQVNLPSTTIGGSGVDGVSTTIALASVSGIQPGNLLYVDRETILVQTVNTGPSTVTGLRGYSGIPAAHANGTTVYYGSPQFFYRSDPPSSSCIVGSSVNPWINIATSTVFQCASQAPVAAGYTAVGSWAVIYPQPAPSSTSFFTTAVVAPIFGSTANATRIESSLAAPGTTVNGDWWVSCAGTSPSRTCSLKFQDTDGSVRTLVSITF